MIITNKRITATKATMAFILHPRHHICLRSCLDLLLKAVALSDKLSVSHRGWREGLNDITGFFYLVTQRKILISTSANLFPLKHENDILPVFHPQLLAFYHVKQNKEQNKTKKPTKKQKAKVAAGQSA